MRMDFEVAQRKSHVMIDIDWRLLGLTIPSSMLFRRSLFASTRHTAFIWTIMGVHSCGMNSPYLISYKVVVCFQRLIARTSYHFMSGTYNNPSSHRNFRSIVPSFHGTFGCLAPAFVKPHSVSHLTCHAFRFSFHHQHSQLYNGSDFIITALNLPKMADILSMLPNENFDRIFSFLSRKKEDVSACRLICRSFKELSSPYLLTEVVFARRLDTIAKLKQIVEHEYFHKYVTELILDASCYEERLAIDWAAYSDEYHVSLHRFTDPEWDQRIQRDDDVWREVENISKPEPACGRFTGTEQLTSIGAACSRDVAKVTTGSEFDPVFEANDDCSETHDEQLSVLDDASSMDSLEYAYSGAEDEKTSHLCHRSFPNYCNFYKNQKRLDRKLNRILDWALGRLTGLKSIVLTDWRTLARDHESYYDLSRRFFGYTLPPTDLPFSSNPEIMVAKIDWSIMAKHKTRIEQFSVRSHMFENNTHGETGPLYLQQLPTHIPCSWIRHMSDMLTALRRLDLGLSVPKEFDDEVEWEDSIQKALGKASNLEHLALRLYLPDRRDTARTDVDEVHTEQFNIWLADQFYPQLRSLQLYAWHLPHSKLQAFLERHRSSLRFVHFLDCLSFGDQILLARWAGKNLDLSGIEIRSKGLGSISKLQAEKGIVASEETEGLPLSRSHENLWLGGRRNYIARVPVLKPFGCRPWFWRGERRVGI